MTRIEKEKKKEAIEFAVYIGEYCNPNTILGNLQNVILRRSQINIINSVYESFKRSQPKKRSHNKKGGK